jgi:type VII secretion integral membrane protein EccD
VTELVSVGSDLDSPGDASVSPVPDLVRVAVTGRHRQVDVYLPLDIPVALLLPEVVRLVDNDSGTPAGGPTPPVESSQNVVWSLVVGGAGASLAPDDTLRGAEVVDDDVLHLRSRPTLAAPTLYDDVVDAAARLNRQGHPGWSAVAAARIAYVGIGLASAAWVYLTLVDGSGPRRAAILGLSAFAVVALLVVGTILARSTETPHAGAVLGWACLPIAAAGCWAGLSPYGVFALVGGALALVLLCACGIRLVGGLAGFTAAAVLFVCTAAGLLIEAAGLTRADAALCVSVAATVATLAVPRWTARLDHSRPAPPEADGDGSPADTDIGGRASFARALRSGLSAGLAISAGCAVTVLVWAAPTPSWSVLTLGAVSAVALGLPRPGAGTSTHTATGLPAVALLIAVAFAAFRGDECMSVAGASALVACAVGLAAVGSRSGRPHRRSRTLLVTLSYIAFASIGPTALWVIGAYSRWGWA